MSCNQVNIYNTNNQVHVVNVEKQIRIVTPDNCNNTTITQPVTNVIHVLTGPIGQRGETGQAASGSSGIFLPFTSSQGVWTTTSSIYISGSLYVSSSIFGTASAAISSSHAINADTASYYAGSVISSSHAITSDTASYYGGSVATSSYALTSATASYYNGTVVSASYATTSSYTVTAQTASYYAGAIVSASHAINADSASYYGGSVATASHAINADTASYYQESDPLFSAWTGSYNTGSFSGSFIGNLTGTSSFANNSATASHARYAESAGNGGVTRIIAGSNISLSPLSGIGEVTINSTAIGGGSSGSNYVGTFSSQSIWTLTHNLGSRYVVIQTFDINHNQIIPQRIQLYDTNTVLISFPVSASGYAVASLGGALSSSYAIIASTATTASHAIFSLSSSYAISSSYANVATTSSYAHAVADPDYRIITASYSVLPSDRFIEVTQAFTTQSLISAVGVPAKQYTFINASSDSIRIQTNGLETIGNNYNANDTYITIFIEEAVTLVSNNANWRIV